VTAATAVLALAGGACGTLPGAPSRPVAAGHLAAVHDPGQVTWLQLPAACHARAGGRLPDPACTPGSVDPGVTQSSIGSTICRRGYTSSVRPPASQTGTVKRVMYRLYGIPRGIPAELDHLVPIELGGSNAVTNLWPENYRGFLNADDKDRLENYLHDAVCSGRMPLQTAQEAIATDWVKAYCAARLGECPAGLQ